MENKNSKPKKRYVYHEEWNVDQVGEGVGVIGTEGLREITMSENAIDQLQIEKNRCAKHILESIELTYGHTAHWDAIRRIVLRSVNDYHRLVIRIIQQIAQEVETEVEDGVGGEKHGR